MVFLVKKNEPTLNAPSSFIWKLLQIVKKNHWVTLFNDFPHYVYSKIISGDTI